MATNTNETANERWADIPGFPGYQASTLGRIRSFRRGKPRIRRPARYGGYLALTLRADSKDHLRRVHRLVLAAFVGPCPPGMEACHRDGNWRNNRLDNLRWDTHSANQADTFLNRVGLTRDQVEELRRAMFYGGHMVAPTLANRLGISEQVLWQIAGGQRLPNCPGPIKTAMEHATQRAARVHDMRREGLSMTVIAPMLELTVSGVSRIANRNRLADAPTSAAERGRPGRDAYPWYLRNTLEALDAKPFGPGGHFTTTCPVCGDILDVRVHHWQRIYLTCYSDCRVPDILAAVGLPGDAARADPVETDAYWEACRSNAGRDRALRGWA